MTSKTTGDSCWQEKAGLQPFHHPRRARIVVFDTAKPTGCRCSGGRPTDFEPLEQCADEIIRLVRNELDPKLSEAASRVIVSRLSELIGAVRSGGVRFGGADPEAKVMDRHHQCLYELRPRPPRGGLAQREVRLYCAEPKVIADLSLGLHLATKPSGEADRGNEQNEAIDEAVERGKRWEMIRLRATIGD